MSLAGSAHSELPLLSRGADSSVPCPAGQRRDLEDECRSSLGSLLTQESHWHHALGFVQTLKTGALPILNMRRETLEGKRAMWFSHTQAHPHSLPNAFGDVEEQKAFSWCNRNNSSIFCHLKDSLEYLIQFFPLISPRTHRELPWNRSNPIPPALRCF